MCCKNLHQYLNRVGWSSWLHRSYLRPFTVNINNNKIQISLEWVSTVDVQALPGTASVLPWIQSYWFRITLTNDTSFTFFYVHFNILISPSSPYVTPRRCLWLGNALVVRMRFCKHMILKLLRNRNSGSTQYTVMFWTKFWPYCHKSLTFFLNQHWISTSNQTLEYPRQYRIFLGTLCYILCRDRQVITFYQKDISLVFFFFFWSLVHW